mmetsp:Transcript_59664/g.69726  ORF Transcript_59664/g.69726 Transcript_59664/m.69726 type:complete len:917 (-) Transcript_59664:132-2882(-)|eukprot:CAMPEP_0194379744 /NCGR_PEP_ID=MMETSP0174-20130528/40256_1 /TAXON_ID=216777 /ORGANISM="Proboscia alata, Strain PI-D3" /LENGTH=916 /DNA_ID=CAMNT_0039162627 /DNA_START=204 /DNA_END=2954 /DNA_ORIENTATION=-
MRFATAALICALSILDATTLIIAAEESSSEKAKGPPPFFLQDGSDGLCLAGEEFKRCSIDTLFYVVGAPGSYQIHKRPADAPFDLTNQSEDPNSVCITKKSCDDPHPAGTHPVKLAKCTHCGAKAWNILGDATQGYVLTEGDGKVCVTREQGTNKAMTALCDAEDVPYTPLQLQFAVKKDIEQMSSPSARFIAAASDNDAKLVKELIESGVDVNSRDWDEVNALIPAASSGHIDMVKLLIEKGIDVNGADKDKITALMEAAITNNVEIAKMLLDAGAEVDAAAASGVTALWLAAGEGQIEALKLLLERQADANNVRMDSITALMTASANGHAHAVNMLIAEGADVTAADADGMTSLMNAAEFGSVEVINALIGAKGEEDKGEYVNTVSTNGYTPLIIAAAHGKLDAATALLVSGAKPDVKHDNGVTALMYAAAGGFKEVAEALLAAGADVNMIHSNEGNAFLEAATGGSVKVVNLLMEEHGADYKIIDADGVSPIMSSASQGHTEVLQILLDKLKANLNDEEFAKYINMPSHSGGTAIMFAAGSGHHEPTKLLLDAGAEIDAIAQATPDYLEQLAKAIEDGTVDQNEIDPHVDGVTALHVAAQGGHAECVDILLAVNSKADIKDDEDRTALTMAIAGNYADIATVLVKSGRSDPNTPYVDEEGEAHNLLMDAIIVENVEFSTALLEAGASVYHIDGENKVSTLLQAAHRGMGDIVKLVLQSHLTQNGMENFIDLPSEEGITPLIGAASEGHVEALKLLIAANANVNASDKDGTTPLMAASARGHQEAVKALIEAKADINVQNEDGHTALMFAYNGKNQVETLWERYVQFVAEGTAEEGGKKESEVDDNDTGPIIKEALETHTALVESLLQAGADVKLVDKEGHTASDFDYNPDADSDILEKEERVGKMRDESKNEL